MVENPDTQCWNTQHIVWSILIALPFFLLWGIILPIYVFKKLKARSRNLKDPEVYSKYSFLYEGLKKDYYYWYI